MLNILILLKPLCKIFKLQEWRQAPFEKASLIWFLMFLESLIRPQQLTCWKPRWFPLHPKVDNQCIPADTAHTKYTRSRRLPYFITRSAILFRNSPYHQTIAKLCGRDQHYISTVTDTFFREYLAGSCNLQTPRYQVSADTRVVVNTDTYYAVDPNENIITTSCTFLLSVGASTVIIIVTTEMI